MLKEAFEQLENWFKSNGYSGGELFMIGKYYNDHGGYYIIYDAERWKPEKIFTILDNLYT